MSKRDPRPPKKLSLDKRTLRRLEDIDLEQVAGGSRGRGTVIGQPPTALC